MKAQDRVSQYRLFLNVRDSRYRKILYAVQIDLNEDAMGLMESKSLKESELVFLTLEAS